ncbi:MAG: hypothetical protein ACK55Z_20725, partial [bacterium]
MCTNAARENKGSASPIMCTVMLRHLPGLATPAGASGKKDSAACTDSTNTAKVALRRGPPMPKLVLKNLSTNPLLRV